METAEERLTDMGRRVRSTRLLRALIVVLIGFLSLIGGFVLGRNYHPHPPPTEAPKIAFPLHFVNANEELRRPFPTPYATYVNYVPFAYEADLFEDALYFHTSGYYPPICLALYHINPNQSLKSLTSQDFIDAGRNPETLDLLGNRKLVWMLACEQRLILSIDTESGQCITKPLDVSFFDEPLELDARAFGDFLPGLRSQQYGIAVLFNRYGLPLDDYLIPEFDGSHLASSCPASP
jgi:hypothetical protein